MVYFYSIPPTGKYTSALLFWGINSSSERHRELFVGCWSLLPSMGGRSHCNCPALNNLHTKIKYDTDRNIINDKLCCCCFPQCKNICVCFVQNGIPFFNIQFGTLSVFYLIFALKPNKIPKHCLIWWRNVGSLTFFVCIYVL